MALANPKAASALLGCPRPRIGPPRPLRHGLAEYRQVAADLDISPMPWQDTVATYLTALGPDDLWLYREVAAIVGRQNGKTTLTKPLIVQRLKAGRHIMHIAQVRELPRIMHEELADVFETSYPELLPRRRGKVLWPRRGAGSESIVLTNGGTYRIASAIRGSARGFSIDDLIIDELREMDSFDVVNSAKPAQRFSDNPQTIYLSNMGDEDAVVLNSLPLRAEDPSLAYLEWSADPSYDAGDRRGWVQSNPAIGHYPQVLHELEKDYVSAKLGGNLAGFETEALCRKVPSMRERLVDEFAWSRCEGDTEAPKRPAMAVSMDPDGRRASAAIAWPHGDDIALRLVFDVTGDPIDTDALGTDMAKLAARMGIREVGGDPLTDAELGKFFKKFRKVAGSEYANASARFVTIVNAHKLVWSEASAVTDDLLWTAKKPHDESGSFQAVRAKDDRPIPAALAAIRAVYLASGPKPSTPRVM